MDEVYYKALNLIGWIDERLRDGRVHFRDHNGRLLQTLDEVVPAILEDRLRIGEEDEYERVDVALA